MGRKKKPFIDKKHAQTFSLVPRSQKDPLHDDPEEAQYVLKQVKDSKSGSVPLFNKDDRLSEQQKYGIYFDDDYDYLQHLKEPGATVLEPVGDSLQSATDGKPLLPKDLFGSEVKIEGHDERVLPISGPQPGWDPDIVAALEAAETSNTLGEDELEDDFVTMANGGEVGLPVHVTEHFDDGDDDGGSPWWAGRGDFAHPGLGSAPGVRDEELSDISSSRADGSGQGKKGAAQFTEYSITSSVVPRSEALTLLDDRFEQFMVGYDDSQLGAPEEEEEEEGDGEGEVGEDGDVGSGQVRGGAMVRSDYNKLLLESAVEEFERNFAHHLQQDEESGSEDNGDDDDLDTESDSPELVPVAPSADTRDADTNKQRDEPVEESADISEEEDEGEESDRESHVLVEVDERPQERWDCESILSTYSNLYNHPTKIVEPSDPLKKQIKLSKKTGIPLEVVPGPVPKEVLTEPSTKKVSVTRPRNENKEEKRARKQAIKEERKVRRAEKKATRLAFKSEELKLERTLAGRLPTAAVV